MAHGVTPEALALALAAARPDARPPSSSRRRTTGWRPTSAAAPRSPTRAGVPLIVDCAWGAHFGFHAALPRLAAALGADAMLASTHKIVGSLTQSAMLLVSRCGRVDVGAVARAVRLVRSTSPSALLMASLDAARRQLAVHGELLLDRTIKAAARGARGDRGRSRAARSSARSASGAPGSPAGIRCGS